jgi:predicted Zn-dependent protease with MMP-like domain
MNRGERERFDTLLEQVIAALPQRIHDLLEEAPLIVEDHPSPELIAELGLDPGEENLCGLHSGAALTERSVVNGHDLPETIHIFREGVIDHAGGWEPWIDDDGERWGGADAVQEEIRITLLHEVGHHFGLDENDLADLGYD